MRNQLSPTTKELIFASIKEIENQIELKSEVIFQSSENENDHVFQFVEMYEIEKQLLEMQLEHLKHLLFNH